MVQFEYYVLNYDANAKKVINFNVFCNIEVNECTNIEIEKYLGCEEKYGYDPLPYVNKETYTVYGFEALCRKIRDIIKHQEWSRREYEIYVSDAFQNDIEKFEKWDCYKQCEPNMRAIVRECLAQYKENVGNDY